MGADAHYDVSMNTAGQRQDGVAAICRPRRIEDAAIRAWTRTRHTPRIIYSLERPRLPKLRARAVASN